MSTLPNLEAVTDILAHCFAGTNFFCYYLFPLMNEKLRRPGGTNVYGIGVSKSKKDPNAVTLGSRQRTQS